jgi:hypothetical protein
MKKTLGIAMIVAVLASVGVRAEDSAPGRLGIGYQGTIIHESGANIGNGIALRFAPKPLGGSLSIATLDEDSKDGGDDSDHLLLEAKCFYSLISREHSNFYVGGMLGLDNYDENGDDENTVGIGVLLGTEWYFAELPELGFNFEVGYAFAGDDEEGTDSVLNGTTVSVGATYYF